MDSTQTVSGLLRTYILTHVLTGEDPSALHDDDHLIDSGVLDSLALVNLVSFISQQFGIEVPADRITVENFASITHLTRFIQAQIPGAPA